MPWDDGLTGKAYKIAADRRPRLRVRAGPGTGKTFALMRRVARLLEEGTAANEVLVSTFTRTAATDLKGSLRNLATPDAEKVYAKTIHSLCFGILARSHVLESTGRVPRPLLDFETRFLLEDLTSGEFGTIRDKRERLKAFETAWARLQSDSPGGPSSDVDRRFRDAVVAWTQFHRAMLIGEVVPETFRYLNSNPAAEELSMFSSVLVDEYQDLNVAEQHLIDLLASNADLTVVGDANQSIYSFKLPRQNSVRRL